MVGFCDMLESFVAQADRTAAGVNQGRVGADGGDTFDDGEGRESGVVSEDGDRGGGPVGAFRDVNSVVDGSLLRGVGLIDGQHEANQETVRSVSEWGSVMRRFLEHSGEVAEQRDQVLRMTALFRQSAVEMCDVDRGNIERIDGPWGVVSSEQSVGLFEQKIQRCYSGGCHRITSLSIKGRA